MTLLKKNMVFCILTHSFTMLKYLLSRYSSVKHQCHVCNYHDVIQRIHILHNIKPTLNITLDANTIFICAVRGDKCRGSFF